MVIPIINNTQLSDLNYGSFSSDAFELYMMISALSGKSIYLFIYLFAVFVSNLLSVLVSFRDYLL